MKLQLITLTFILLSFVAGCGNENNESNTKPPSRDAADTKQETSELPDDGEESTNDPQEVVFGDRFPEVLAVKLTPLSDANWRFAVTLSSKYDSRERYADAWRVLDAEGQQLGIRVLGHDHASEQPFTRTQAVQIPSETKIVLVEGRDQANGWSGQRFQVEMPDQP